MKNEFNSIVLASFGRLPHSVWEERRAAQPTNPVVHARGRSQSRAASESEPAMLANKQNLCYKIGVWRDRVSTGVRVKADVTRTDCCNPSRERRRAEKRNGNFLFESAVTL